MLLSVCICTFRRPDQLLALLESLAAQPVPAGTQIELVVVDNDPEQSGRAVANRFAASHPEVPLDYSHCPQRNISLARNQSVQRASGELLYFIDDDEVALENWITSLHDTLQATGADVVSGRLEPDFREQPPPWMVDTRFFHRDVPATGKPMALAGIGNCVVRRAALAGYMDNGRGPFDPEFGRTGGEDSFLLRRMRADGLYITGCQDAVVREKIPAQRTSWQWMCARARRTGAIFAIVESRVVPGPLGLTRVRLLVMAMLKWAFASVMSLLPLGQAFRRRWALRRESYRGHIDGVAGRVEPAY